MIKIVRILFLLFFVSQNADALMKADMPKSAKQGSLVRVLITDPEGGPHDVHFYPVGWPEKPDHLEVHAVQINADTQLALIPIGADAKPGLVLVSVFSRTFGYSLTLEIKEAGFPVSRDTQFVGELKGKLLDDFRGQKEELKKIFTERTEKRYWREDLKFSQPLKNMEVTSPFGKIRHKVSKKDGKWDINHFGADLHADVGTPVYAVEKGVVRLATKFLAEGKIVIIDHGYGLFSLYFHLLRLKVYEGDIVNRGDVIAWSGQTGAAIGPHLHFEWRLYGTAISPWNFMPEPPMFEQKAVPPPAKKKRRGAK